MSIYKIVPSEPAISLSTSSEGHQVLEPSFLLPSSTLDTNDGFLHMSTSTQVPLTLKRFFPTSTNKRDSLYLFKVDYDDLTRRDGMEIKWETTDKEVVEPWKDERGFPHIYKTNGEGLVVFGGEKANGVVVPQSVVEVVSEIGEEVWDGALGRLKEWFSV